MKSSYEAVQLWPRWRQLDIRLENVIAEGMAWRNGVKRRNRGVMRSGEKAMLKSHEKSKNSAAKGVWRENGGVKSENNLGISIVQRHAPRQNGSRNGAKK
jgi:endo-1,4-beta-mannosidase